MSSQAIAWCFTLNNPDEDEVLIPQSWDPSEYKYLVYQLEQGKEGTKHLQGYISFVKRIRFNAFRKYFPGERAHLEVARGTPLQNQTYCTKEEGRLAGPWEFGKLPEPGKRNDMTAIQQMILDGATLEDIGDDYFSQFCRYKNSFKEYILLKAPQENIEKEVYVFWGKTGTGKSRECWDRWPGHYRKHRNSGEMQFFDGYTNQSVIVVDEFYGWFKWSWLLDFTDRYPVSLEVKHGQVPMLATTIVFTSNKHPREWYRNVGYEWDDDNPFKRRIKEVREFTKSVPSVSPVVAKEKESIIVDNSEEWELDDLYMRGLKCRLKK